jgi:hypothetical protein
MEPLKLNQTLEAGNRVQRSFCFGRMPLDRLCLKVAVPVWAALLECAVRTQDLCPRRERAR